jgi:hypothetical protein
VLRGFRLVGVLRRIVMVGGLHDGGNLLPTVTPCSPIDNIEYHYAASKWTIAGWAQAENRASPGIFKLTQY